MPEARRWSDGRAAHRVECDDCCTRSGLSGARHTLAPSLPPPLMTDLEAILRDPAVHAAVPGLSLAFLQVGEVATTYAGGCRGPHDSAKVDVETVFEAASLTKPMVSFIALQLAEEGRLDLDAPLQARLLPVSRWRCSHADACSRRWV